MARGSQCRPSLVLVVFPVFPPSLPGTPKGQALWVWDALLGRVGGMGRCPLLQGDHLGRGQCVREMGTPLGERPEDWPHACKSVFIAGGHHGAAMSPGLLSLNQPSDEGVAEIKLMI